MQNESVTLEASVIGRAITAKSIHKTRAAVVKSVASDDMYAEVWCDLWEYVCEPTRRCVDLSLLNNIEDLVYAKTTII